jgi:HSP20 family protein
MTLIPYDPFRHLDNFRDNWDRLFSNDWFPFRAGQGMGRLNADVYETENEVVAAFDIPGLEKKEDINIDVDTHSLTISGTVNRMQEVREEHMHRKERFIGKFHRTISLPSPVSSEGVTATYKNGVLEVRMPKMKGDTRRKIDIQFH